MNISNFTAHGLKLSKLSGLRRDQNSKLALGEQSPQVHGN